MKRYLIPILIVLVLTSVTISCGQNVVHTTKATPSVTPSAPTIGTEKTPSSTDAKLIEFQQIKTKELNQLNADLADLQTKIVEKEREYEQESQSLKAEEEALIKKYGSLPVSLNEYSFEYISAHLTGGVGRQLQQLHEQEKPLLATKKYLEKDIKEIEQYTQLDKYYEFKLSQLNDITSQLVVLKIDIDQKTLLKESTSQLQQRYNEFLLQRQLMQQDIEQLQKLA
jgi:hypothetical protein